MAISQIPAPSTGGGGGAVDYWFFIPTGSQSMKLDGFLFTDGFWEMEAVSSTGSSTPFVTVSVVDNTGATLDSQITYDFDDASTDNPSVAYWQPDLTGQYAVLVNSTASNTYLRLRRVSDGANTAVALVQEYTSSGNLTVNSTVPVALIGGGGAGGGANGFSAPGLGGSSGFLATGSLPAGTYAFTIGSGGSGSAGSKGGTGGTTSIHNYTASGGEGGNHYNTSTSAASGGSNGGTAYSTNSAGENGSPGSGVQLPSYITPGNRGLSANYGNNSGGGGGGTYAGGGAGSSGTGNNFYATSGGGGYGGGGGGGGACSLQGGAWPGASGAAGRIYILNL